MTAAQARQMKRGLVVGTFTALTCGTIGVLTGSYAAWGLAIFGVLAVALSVFLLRLDAQAGK